MSGVEIRAGTPGDDAILADHYLALWDSYGTPPGDYADDARAAVLRFIGEARTGSGLGVFLATSGGAIAGSVACNLHRAPYPVVIRPERRRFGYVWSVFVEPAHRRRGVARALVSRALDHLRSLNCTTAVLHASEAGLRTYQDLGFSAAKETRLDLTARVPRPGVEPEHPDLQPANEAVRTVPFD